MQRKELLALAGELRPELHRYCSRLMGSVIDGEDVVQDTLTKALSLEDAENVQVFRAWLFRVAHNRALDLLRSRSVRATEPVEAAGSVVDETSPDAMEMLMRRDAVNLAVSRFAELPVMQRSIIILKDVLDEPLSAIAEMLDLTVDSVKAHLARGRARLREINLRPNPTPAPASSAVSRYTALFNRQDWDGLRALLAADVKLHQSTHPVRTGAADVGMFFSIYATSKMWLAPAWLEGREVIAVFENRDAGTPDYFMWLEWRDGKISFIRDYRYVRYVVSEAELALAPPSAEAK